jgi:heme exporter protein A
MIWILDEPLTALDKDFVTEFEMVLKKHLDQNGMLIVATHRELKVATHLVIRICLS